MKPLQTHSAPITLFLLLLLLPPPLWERAHFSSVMPQMIHRSENSEILVADEASMLKGTKKVRQKLQTSCRNVLWSQFPFDGMDFVQFDGVVL